MDGMVNEFYEPVECSTLDPDEKEQIVSRAVFEQVMWERDIALEQLAEIGKGLGERMDDVFTAKDIIYCKDCAWHEYVDDDGDDFEVCNYYSREVMGSQFCSEAEPYKKPEEKAEFRRSVDLDNEKKMTIDKCPECGGKLVCRCVYGPDETSSGLTERMYCCVECLSTWTTQGDGEDETELRRYFFG